MRKKLYLFFLTAIVLYNGCDNSVDKIQDFAMQMNGVKYEVELGVTYGKMIEPEAGYSYNYRFSIIFPLRNLNRMKTGGFELFLNPKEIDSGIDREIQAGDDNYKLRLEYHPTWGHKINQGKMLVYSSRYQDGYLKVRFDILEPKNKGRVQGMILEAVLYGYYEQYDTAEQEEPRDELKLEIYNLKFDTVFKRSNI